MKEEVEVLLKDKNRMDILTMQEIGDIIKIESSILEGATTACRNGGYQHVIIPHLTRATGACENFSTLFSTDIFGKTAYLNQTGQLMLEAFLSKFPKTFCFGSSFRKEIKADERHLIEFPLFEIELIDCNLDQLQEEVSKIFAGMFTDVKKNCGKELERLGISMEHLESLMPPYKTMTYKDAVNSLSEFGVKFGDDLKSKHEEELVKRNNGKPLFITHYPQEIKFFNMRLVRDDNSVVHSMDLLMPYSGEAVGAAEREEDYEILMQRLKNSDMFGLMKEEIKKEKGFEEHSEEKLGEEGMKRFEWYTNIIRKHPLKHAGCGIGINRVTQALLQTKDIRHSTAYPLNRETVF